MKLWTEQPDEPDLRFTHDREILKGIKDKPTNAVIYYIGNYPNSEVLENVDKYLKKLKPPNSMWDEVLNTGDSREKGSGYASTGFASKYMEYIVNNDETYAEAMHVRARAMVRPVYIGHHGDTWMYSPASVCINVIEEVVELPHEREGGPGPITFEGWG